MLAGLMMWTGKKIFPLDETPYIVCSSQILTEKNCDAHKLTQKYEVRFPSALVLVNCSIQREISRVLANDYIHPHLLNKKKTF